MPENKYETILKGLQRRLHPGGREAPYGPREGHLPLVPLVACASGFTFSMQASEFHYCGPRDNHGPWTEVELGLVPETREALLPYAERRDMPPRMRIYAWVPLELVARLVLDEGGFA